MTAMSRAAFGLVAALAWNIYAVVVTVIVVSVTIRLGRLAEQTKERERGLLGRRRE